MPLADAAWRQADLRLAGPADEPGARMAPVTFAGCFGWFHPATRPGRFAVLLCPPLGREARWTYRTYRKLAGRLAAAGLPALRFDYPNLGDSCDLPEGDKLPAAWLDSVHVAADWLRAQTGAAQVALVGLRFGALLAAQAASTRTDVAALALLAPVTSGRAYLRELRAMARVAESAPSHDDALEMDGLALSESTQQGLAAMAMPGKVAPAPRVLMLQHGQAGDAFAATLGALGADVTIAPFAGYAGLMRSAISNIVPEADIGRVVAWMEALDVPSTLGHVQPMAPAALHPVGCIEQPVVFGPGERLFGILCRPDDGRPPGLVVIIGNSGGDPRTGISRLSVVLARQLARDGVASFRMDFAGLGDSILGPDDRDGHLFSTDRRPDVTAALDRLQALGFRRFGAFGLCTGAYHALAAAASDARIDAISLLNLPTFQWKNEDPVDLALPTQFRASGSYLTGLKDWRTWRRILQGQIAVRSIFGVIARRVGDRVLLRAVHVLNDAGIGLGWAMARPRHTMRQLARRGVTIQMVLSGEDPGIDTLETHFGRRGHKLLALGGAEIAVRHGLDHTLSLGRMRDVAVIVIAEYFSRIAGTQEAAPAPAADLAHSPAT